MYMGEKKITNSFQIKQKEALRLFNDIYFCEKWMFLISNIIWIIFTNFSYIVKY